VEAWSFREGVISGSDSAKVSCIVVAKKKESTHFNIARGQWQTLLDQVSLELVIRLPQASHVLGLQACATMPSLLDHILLCTWKWVLSPVLLTKFSHPFCYTRLSLFDV
jgi:hypothetical protein